MEVPRKDRGVSNHLYSAQNKLLKCYYKQELYLDDFHHLSTHPPHTATFSFSFLFSCWKIRISRRFAKAVDWAVKQRKNSYFSFDLGNMLQELLNTQWCCCFRSDTCLFCSKLASLPFFSEQTGSWRGGHRVLRVVCQTWKCARLEKCPV